MPDLAASPCPDHRLPAVGGRARRGRPRALRPPGRRATHRGRPRRGHRHRRGHPAPPAPRPGHDRRLRRAAGRLVRRHRRRRRAALRPAREPASARPDGLSAAPLGRLGSPRPQRAHRGERLRGAARRRRVGAPPRPTRPRTSTSTTTWPRSPSASPAPWPRATTSRASSSVVDVGGGQGALLAAVLERHPHLTGTVLDLPQAVATEPPSAALAPRWRAVAGSFFDEVPARGRLPAEGDPARLAGRPVRRHPAHLRAEPAPRWRRPRGGDCPGTPGLRGGQAAFSDLNMLVMPGGRERTEQEYGALFAAAGLTLTRVVDTPTRFSVLEGRQASPEARSGGAGPLAARQGVDPDQDRGPDRRVAVGVRGHARRPARRNASSATWGNIPNIRPNTISIPPPARAGTSSRNRSA